MSDYDYDPKFIAEMREEAKQRENERRQNHAEIASQILLPFFQEGELTSKELLDRFFAQQGLYDIQDNIARFEKQKELEDDFDSAFRLLMQTNAIIQRRDSSFKWFLTDHGKQLLSR